MRKIFVLMLGFLMLFSTSAFGEELDLKSMELEELIEKYDEIYKELMLRITDAACDLSIARGQYVAGIDIALGRYEFTCTNAIVEGDYEYAYISVYKILNPEEFEKQLDYTWYDGVEECYYSKKIDVGSKVAFTLEENMILVITRCDGILQTPSHEWAP